VGRLPRAAESKGRQNEYLNGKKFDFLLSTNFKLLREVKGNPTNNCDFLIFIISSKALKNLLRHYTDSP
jgi:hypothetical protein